VKRSGNRSEVGQEAPLVITPKAVARLFKQVAGSIRRAATKRRTE
jgi:hypothetical protein